MKFRVERDVLADAVAWTARSLPARPPVPVLAGLLLEARPTARLALSGFDYEVSARVEVAGRRREPGPALVSGRLLAEISAVAAGPPGRGRDRRHQGRAHLRRRPGSRCSTLPVEDYPTLPEMPDAAGVAARRRVRRRRRPGRRSPPGRDDTLPVLTGVRVEIEGETLTLAATDRYRLAVRELTWTPEQPGLSRDRAGPGPDARRHGQVADLGRRGHDRAGQRRRGRGPDRLRGRPAAARPRRLLDGEFPKYRSLLPGRVAPAWRPWRPPALVEAVKRVALVAERNTPVRLTFADGEVVLEAGSGDEAQASESLERGADGDDITIAFNPTYLLDGLSAARRRRTPSCRSPRPTPAGRDHRQGRRRRRPPARLPLPAHAGPAVGLTARISGPVGARWHRYGGTTSEGTRMDIGMVGLGRMGGNMRERLRARRPRGRRLRPQPRRERRRDPRGPGRGAAGAHGSSG